MIYPFLCIDNFFEDPKKILNFSASLDFTSDPNGRWPGFRSPETNKINLNFFKYSTTKMISVLYPMCYKQLTWKACQYFVLIKNNHMLQSWVHSDEPSEFTTIVYLTNEEVGTNIYDHKQFHSKFEYKDVKESYFKGNIDKEQAIEAQKNHLKDFTPTIKFTSKFNRMILFDASCYHAPENLIGDHRLTLITFFTQLTGDSIKYPLTEMRRIQ
jgi:hypothetical protein